MRSKANYSTFRLFKQNIEVLTNLRPDLFVKPASDSYVIVGEITKRDDFIKIFESQCKIVWAINASLILNTTAFFEGLLENILLRKVGKTTGLKTPVLNIVNEYKIEIIKASSLNELSKNFQKLFEVKLIDLFDNKLDYQFIEHFYLVRHLLVHGSMIDTDYIKLELGSKLVHSDKQYINLMSHLKKRYSLNHEVNIEFYWLILCSEIIDDFCSTIISTSDHVISSLKSRKLLDTTEYWGDFISWPEWGKLNQQQNI